VSSAQFLSSQQLEELLDQQGADLQDEVLHFPAKQETWRLVPAVKFVGLLDGVDTLGLIGRHLSRFELNSLGGEYMHGTLILEGAAYECEEGFAASNQQSHASPAPGAHKDTPRVVQGPPPPAPKGSKSAAEQLSETAPANAEQPAKSEPEKSDKDLLINFLLENLK